MALEDPFHALDTDPGLKVAIGSTELDAAVSGGTLHTTMNGLPTARLKLSTRLLAGQPVDYFGDVAVRLGRRDGPTFSGNVLSAEPTGDELDLDCQTHPSLTESKVGPFEAFDCDAREIMHVMTLAGGLSEDLVHIEGLDELPLEIIEVLIPLRGLSVTRPLRLGRLTLIDPAETMSLAAPFSSDNALEPFRRADCHALYRMVDRRIFDVENRALAAVDVVLGWLVTRARYGLTHLPQGEPQRFIRNLALSRPSRAEVVISRGLDSGRTWLRGLLRANPDETVVISSSQWVPPAPETLSDAQRLSLDALRDAVEEQDPLRRVQALFQAIEFYVAGVTVPLRFSNAEVRRVRKAVPKDIDAELRERAMQLLAKLNEPPLMAKLRETARGDGVPMTEGELDLLWRVRGARNRTVHGHAARPPDENELNYAVSLVARLLLYGLVRRRRDQAA